MATAKRGTKSHDSEEQFAIIETGGKQYRVSPGSLVIIEKIASGEAGKEVSFEQVLLVNDRGTVTVGTPYVTGARVEGTIDETGRNEKVSVVKYKAKSRYFKRRGHRQPYTKVKISSIK